MDPDFGPIDSFDQTFQAMQGMFWVLFAIAIVMMIARLARGAVRVARNSASPEVTAVARIVDKRVSTSGGGAAPSVLDADGLFANNHSDPITETHFVTFEQSGGARFELEVPAVEYGLLVVGDSGTVAMQGSRFLGFSREVLR